MTLHISLETNPHSKDIQVLDDGIMAYAKKKKAFSPWDFFAFFIRDEEHTIMGGCNGNTLYGSLYVDQLWVNETIRGQGFGTKLMEAALDYGKEHGCTFAIVDTMDWEAIDFYQGLGFVIEFERRGFEKNSVCYSLRKDLFVENNPCIKPKPAVAPLQVNLVATDPLVTIKKLINERYKDALAIFWAGSVAKSQGTKKSDLDLVIVYEKLPTAYREAFVYDEWPIDAFIHDRDTLHYFFEESKTGSGISGLIHMVLYGQEVTPSSLFSKNLIKLAQQYQATGPEKWTKEKIDTERFLITDILDDIECPKSRAEQLASTAWLFEALSQFYFRAQGKWCASGKSIMRYLEQDNPKLASEFSASFEKVFQVGETHDLKHLTQKILQPYGGFLWNGFRSEAPLSMRISKEQEEL